MKKSKQEIRNRILTFTKKRGSKKPVSPSQVTRDLFSDVWRDHLDEVKDVTASVQHNKLIRITQNGKDITIDKDKEPVILSLYPTDE